MPGTLSVFLDDLVHPALTVSLGFVGTLNLDGGRACVGFTAATGAGFENHDILNWLFAGACGNGIIEGSEECDDGGQTPTCDADCTFVECGDMWLNLAAGEECDPPDGVTGDNDCQLILCACGDLDSDNEVTLSDFVTFARCFGLTTPTTDCSEGEFLCSDRDGNGEANLSDFVTFARLFGEPASGSPPNCGE